MATQLQVLSYKLQVKSRFAFTCRLPLAACSLSLATSQPKKAIIAPVFERLLPFSRHLSEGRCSRFNLSGSDGALSGLVSLA
ncbi:hypothetical protein SAMN04490186_2409 [Pseudomonas grimontii]|uniref:Uncharacterized protein n=1 Tax=Pseudomonas grimontii TaxID=129847 RepID=A0ABY0TKV0_9PSED|nr:hypothetical protein SAMN04490186_2409 [Pseudomonas grimontii]